MDDDSGGIFQSLLFWRGWAVAATLAAVFAFAANIQVRTDGYVADYVAIVGDGAAPMWVINADLGEGVLNVRSVSAKPSGSNEYVLWVGGAHPQRLGVLPINRDRAALSLDGTVQGLLANTKTLRVASQPLGSEEEPSSWLHEVSVARL